MSTPITSDRGAVPRPGSRARHPDREGIVARDGVPIFYEVYDNPGRPTVLLLPAWSIVRSRFWKGQIPYLARHYRVVTFDGRGSGRSGRPAGSEAYRDAEYTADVLAVMAATGTDRAVLVALSRGVTWAVHVAAECPDRVAGLVAIASACDLPDVHPPMQRSDWDGPASSAGDWRSFNRTYWSDGGYDDFLRYFFARSFPEPHSTKQIEDGIGWGREVAPATLAATVDGRLDSAGTPTAELLARVRCPVLVIHGTKDRIRPVAVAKRVAELADASLVLIDGAGHLPPARDPVVVNRLVREFVDRLHPPVASSTWVRAARRPKRALYLSSPIGLGHARRDIAVANELRIHHPGLEIDWLAQHPVTRLLEAAGERIHPASSWLANESAHIEDEAADHDLHAFQAVRRMDEILVNNFMVFDDVVGADHYDLVIGDEAWEVDYFLHENPERKRFAFAWMTDFVGWLPMPDGGAAEEALTADYNAEMIEQRARYRRLRDRSIFVGHPDDVIDRSFGPGLPRLRPWTSENFEFAGYVTGFPAPDDEDRMRCRRSMGYGEHDRVCVVTVGGSGVGEHLLRRVLAAVPAARRLLPDLKFLVVTGPRIDPRRLPRRRGVTIRGFVPDLHRHLAASDLAIVQGGLTTCMELTAARRPFLYVPLRHHFEQNLHVRHRLERYRAGRCLDYDEVADVATLAEAIAKEVDREVDYLPVESDGAARAGAMLAELL